MSPTAPVRALFDQIVDEGAGFGLRRAGYHALDSLRAEKGFRHWGADMGPADTPYEAGLDFTVALEKATPFLGRDALLASRGRPGRRLLHVRLDDPEPLLYRGESVLREGRIVGRVTSGAYGHTLEAAVGLAFIEAPSPDDLDAITDSPRIEVSVAGRPVPATLGAKPFYDPGGERMRGGRPHGAISG